MSSVVIAVAIVACAILIRLVAHTIVAALMRKLDDPRNKNIPRTIAIGLMGTMVLLIELALLATAAWMIYHLAWLAW